MEFSVKYAQDTFAGLMSQGAALLRTAGEALPPGARAFIRTNISENPMGLAATKTAAVVVGAGILACCFKKAQVVIAFAAVVGLAAFSYFRPAPDAFSGLANAAADAAKAAADAAKGTLG